MTIPIRRKNLIPSPASCFSWDPLARSMLQLPTDDRTELYRKAARDPFLIRSRVVVVSTRRTWNSRSVSLSIATGTGHRHFATLKFSQSQCRCPALWPGCCAHLKIFDDVQKKSKFDQNFRANWILLLHTCDCHLKFVCHCQHRQLSIQYLFPLQASRK